MELLHILGDPFTSVGGDRGIALLKIVSLGTAAAAVGGQAVKPC